MNENSLYPMLLAPIYKEKIWGGRLMEKLLNKKLPAGELIGESWELSVYRDDITYVVNGPLAGTRFDELYKDRPRELTGRTPSPGESFPLLTKFIDSNQLLSLQVHPPDSYAMERDEEYGKTECWYVVYAEPEASIIRGLAPGTTPEAFLEALQTGRDVEKMVRRFPVQTGDFIFMPTGVVHAICEGTIILEIEQNSDMTYRLNDWGRVGPDGRPRPLHIDKGMDVIDFHEKSQGRIEGISYFEAGNRISHMTSCRYFSVEILDLASTYRVDTGGSTFVVLTVVEGEVTVSGEGTGEVRAIKGDTVFLPASPQTATLVPGHGCRVVKAYIDPTHRRFIQPLIRKGAGMEEIEKLIFR